MTELAGGILLLLAVAQAGLPGARWPAAAQGVVLVAGAVFRAVDTGSWLFAAAALTTAAASAVRWTAPATRMPASRSIQDRVMAGASVAVVAVLVPALSLLPPAPGLDILATALSVAGIGVVLLLSGRADGVALAVRAALLAALGAAGGIATLPPALALLAVEGRGWLRRRPSRLVLGALSVAGPALALLPGPPGVAVAGIAAASAVVHALTERRAPHPSCAAGLAVALFGAASVGPGLAPFAQNVMLCGLVLNAAGVLSLVRLRPGPLLAAVLVVDASVWTARGADGALPAGLAVAAWAALLLVWRRPTPGRLASGLSAAHGGVALCAVGLGTAPAVYAGVAHMAGHFAAQASFGLQRDRRTALLMLAGLPPSALFVSEWLLLRASGGALLPVAIVLAAVAAAALRWPSQRHDGWRSLAWVGISTALAAVVWAEAP